MPTDTSPAELLQAAADKLRSLATNADTAAEGHSGLPWHVEECADGERGDCPCLVAQGLTSYHDEPPHGAYYVADAETSEHAAYIAAMHPVVGLALANWLEAEASGYAAVTGVAQVAAELLDVEVGMQGHRATISHSTLPQAVAVARAILGEEPQQ